MPALLVCGQHTCMGGDDMFLSSMLFVGIRLVQLAVLIPMSLFMAEQRSSQERVGCPEPRSNLVEYVFQLSLAYLVVSYVLVFVGLAFDFGIMRSTTKGTPTQPEKRRQVQYLCECTLLPFSLLRVSAITLGLLCVSDIRSYCTCQNEEDTALIRENECFTRDTWGTYFKVLLCTHFIDAFCVACIAAFFLCKCTPKPPPLLSTSQVRWQVCCHCCIATCSLLTCCCIGGYREIGNYSDIAIVLSDYFNNGGTLDIVVSDIIVGLRMLLREQEERRLQCRDSLLRKVHSYQTQTMERGEIADDNVQPNGQSETGGEVTRNDGDDSFMDPELARLALHENGIDKERSKSLVFQRHTSGAAVSLEFRPASRAVLTTQSDEDLMAIAQGAHYMRYARAMYTYKMDFIENPLKAPCVFGLSLIRSLFSKHNYCVEGDNWFGAHEASLQEWTGLERAQLAHANFSEGIGKIPYCIVIDHDWKAVVLAIRGTEALEDVVTDLTLRPASMEASGEQCGFDGTDAYAHAGMLKSSEWIYTELEK